MDSTVKVWDPASGVLQQILTGHARYVFGVVGLAGGKLALAVNGKGAGAVSSSSKCSTTERGPSSDSTASASATLAELVPSIPTSSQPDAARNRAT